MHPDSSYPKWDNSEQVELTVQGASSAPGRGGKTLCLSSFTQGKAIAILYVLLVICIAVATAFIVVNLGKLSQGLAKAQVDRDTIRRDSKRNLSHHQDYLELKISKEFNMFNSRLLNVSKELAGVRLRIEEIQADHVKDPSYFQDAIEIRNLTHTMSKELAEVRRDHDRLQEVLSRVQDELRNITEVICTKCPPGWQRFEKKCYFFSTLTKSWLDAKQFCTNEGSHLVIVNTKQEQIFLSNHITEPSVYWLGLSDSAKEGEWHWLDGSPLSLRVWGPGEPNNVGHQGEDCGSLRFDGKWNNATCSMTEHWICERQC
ncbi:low affinity immunoglobulin epsilon Fc receptor-like [Gopherus flavomarginatus]|uniref:low affinity immunoglobulin epsilon Fc receptor-like n=1 Tax=Gopherus flavomarginatus TaxID=286002 RepID=UPI0021CC1F5A|nr:low affinity immunoglobulin epsilon Fc receptor-like [Gopherus flavomarginatus]